MRKNGNRPIVRNVRRIIRFKSRSNKTSFPNNRKISFTDLITNMFIAIIKMT